MLLPFLLLNLLLHWRVGFPECCVPLLPSPGHVCHDLLVLHVGHVTVSLAQGLELLQLLVVASRGQELQLDIVHS